MTLMRILLVIFAAVMSFRVLDVALHLILVPDIDVAMTGLSATAAVFAGWWSCAVCAIKHLEGKGWFRDSEE